MAPKPNHSDLSPKFTFLKTSKPRRFGAYLSNQIELGTGMTHLFAKYLSSILIVLSGTALSLFISYISWHPAGAPCFSGRFKTYTVSKNMSIKCSYMKMHCCTSVTAGCQDFSTQCTAAEWRFCLETRTATGSTTKTT